MNKVKKEIPNLATTTALNAKINGAKNKIPNTTNLATSAASTAVEKKNTRISEIENKITTDHDHNKYITTQEFN